MRIVLFIIVGILTACKPVSPSKTGTDLLKYGIPDIIHSPNSAKISKLPSNTIVGVSIEADSIYEVHGIITPTGTKDPKKLMLYRKQEIMANPFYSKIVEENNEGFLFEKKLSDGKKSYDFRTIKLVGDSELIYQAGNKREFSEAEAKTMMAWTSTK